MRIEDVSEQTLKGLESNDLYDLRLRAVQVWKKCFHGNSVAEANGLKRQEFLAKYSLLFTEMGKRGLRPLWEDVLDGYLLRRRMMLGLDPSCVGDIVLKAGYACLAGLFLTDPKGAESCDIYLRSDVDNQNKNVLETALGSQVSKPLCFHKMADLGDDEAVVPLFDLVLRPRGQIGKGIAKQFKEAVDSLVYYCAECATAWLEAGTCFDCGGQLSHSVPLERARGDGRGVGGERQGDGGTDLCWCPKCGRSLPHERGIPCTEMMCPDCKVSMTGVAPKRASQDDYLVVQKPGFEETENEIRYRLRDPGRFQEGSFRRIALQQNKPRVYGIIGRLQGQDTTTLQALRFPKEDGWTIPKAQAWVKAHSDVTKTGYGFLEEKKFEHSSALAESEPGWGSVDKEKLPRIAFAKLGDPDKVSTWGFPHHFIQGGGSPDDKGRYTTGRLYLHRGGLANAWARANQEASEISGDEKDHLNAHRKAIGMGDQEKSMAFSFRKLDDEQQVVGGVVYEPGVEDAQGDYTTGDEIWKAMVHFMENSQAIKLMHQGKSIPASVIESYQVPETFNVNAQLVRKGSWWLSVKVYDGEVWKAVKSGTISGFSMGGYARTE